MLKQLMEGMQRDAGILIEASEEPGSKEWFQAVAKRLPGAELDWNIFSAAAGFERGVAFTFKGKGYIRLTMTMGRDRTSMKAIWAPVKGDWDSVSTGAAPTGNALKPETVARWLMKNFAKHGIWK